MVVELGWRIRPHRKSASMGQPATRRQRLQTMEGGDGRGAGVFTYATMHARQGVRIRPMVERGVAAAIPDVGVEEMWSAV